MAGAFVVAIISAVAYVNVGHAERDAHSSSLLPCFDCLRDNIRVVYARNAHTVASSSLEMAKSQSCVAFLAWARRWFELCQLLFVS
jgi:hypothetical protein